jgi:hypothetical protein
MVRGIERSIKRLAQPGGRKRPVAERKLARREEKVLKRSITTWRWCVNTRSDLNRVKMLIEAVNDGLVETARLLDEERRRVINCAFADINIARNYWRDGRVSGLESVSTGLASAAAKLAAAARTKMPLVRSNLATEAHKGIVVALNEIKQALAGIECQEEEAIA